MNTVEASVVAASASASAACDDDDGVVSPPAAPPPPSSLLSASAHYHGGRYALAAEAFRDAADGGSDYSHPDRHRHHRPSSRPHDDVDGGVSSSTGGGDDGGGGVPLIPSSLGRLAAEADSALCRLRSFESSSSSDHCHPSRSRRSHSSSSNHRRRLSLAEDALGANAAYRDALHRAVPSLLHRCNSPGRSRSRSHVRRSHRRRMKMRRMIRQLASSTMAAGVAASWIHLRIGDVISARRVLRESATVAASTLLACDDGGMAHSHDLWDPSSLTMTTMTVEEALGHLDRHLHLHLHRRGGFGEDDVDFDEDSNDGRLAEAVRSLRHSMRVVDLCLDSSSSRGVGGKAMLADSTSPTTSVDDDAHDVIVDHAGQRRVRLEKGDGGEGRGESSVSPEEDCPWSPDSVARELLVDALLCSNRRSEARTHRRGPSPSSKDDSRPSSVRRRPDRMRMRRRRRHELLGRAVAVDPTCRPAKRIKVLLEGRRYLHESSAPRGDDDAGRAAGGEEASSGATTSDAGGDEGGTGTCPDEVLTSLEALARDEGYRPAADLLGCLRARRGGYAEALSAFQSALELDGESSSATSRSGAGAKRRDEGGGEEDDEAGEEAMTRENWETISNMALCFSAMGEPRPAVELLLLLLAARERKKHTQPQRERSTRPATIRITGDGGAEPPPPEPPEPDRITLLWRLFNASSHAADHVTCEAATDELEVELNGIGGGDGGVVSASVLCARAFALLQDRRPSAALGAMMMYRRRGDDDGRGCDDSAKEHRCHRPVEALLRLYEADARICSWSRLRNDEDDGESHDSLAQSTIDGGGDDGDRIGEKRDKVVTSVGIPSVLALTQRARDDLASLRSSATAPLPHRADPSSVDDSWDTLGRRLDVAARNNLGVAHVLAGTDRGRSGSECGAAMRCFEDAALAATRLLPGPDGCGRDEGDDSDLSPRSSSSSSSPPALSFLPAHFNLTLLLWSRGHADGAARVWLTARGIGGEWDDAVSGRGGGTTTTGGGGGARLRVALERGISRHGLLVARRCVGNGSKIRDDVDDRVSRWCGDDGAAGRIGMVDEVQVAAMDVTMLKHAVAVGRRKASLLFKRSGVLMKETSARSR